LYKMGFFNFNDSKLALKDWWIFKNHINIILKDIVIRVIDIYTCIISK
jgi:hypothetical protein